MFTGVCICACNSCAVHCLLTPPETFTLRTQRAEWTRTVLSWEKAEGSRLPKGGWVRVAYTTACVCVVWGTMLCTLWPPGFSSAQLSVARWQKAPWCKLN